MLRTCCRCKHLQQHHTSDIGPEAHPTAALKLTASPCFVQLAQTGECHATLAAAVGTTPLQAGHNPASWMLEVTGGSMAIAAACNNSVDWPSVYAASNLAAENAAQAEVLLAQGLRCGMQLHMTSMYAQPPIIQVRPGWTLGDWGSKCSRAEQHC